MPSLNIAVGVFALGIFTRNLQEAPGRFYFSRMPLQMDQSLHCQKVRCEAGSAIKVAEIRIQDHRIFTCFACFFIAQLGSRVDRIGQPWLPNLPMFVSTDSEMIWSHDLMIQWMRFLISLLCSTSALPKLVSSKRWFTCLLVGTET